MALPEAGQKLFTPETLRAAAKQSQRIRLVPLSLRRAIKKYLREKDKGHMNRKVMLLSESFCRVKEANLQLAASTSRALVEDPHRPVENRAARWKIQSAYGDIGLRYREDETVAYVASRMPAVYTAIHRVLREVRRRLPDFSPNKVLDFGAGPSSALWAMRDVWPQSIQTVNLVEPSKEMQRASQSLLQNLKGLPLIHSYDSIQELNRKLDKKNRHHDLVVSSYALGEIPSLTDRITIVRQLWDLTSDVLVLLEPGTPHGSKIISQMRSYILWMEKRRSRKLEKLEKKNSSDVTSIVVSKPTLKAGSFVVAPCPHDGKCPLENTSKYCHFVQRLERTSSQRVYKRSGGKPLRGFEDEKFCYVALRRGKRPQEAWPLDGMKFETLKEQHAKRNPEDLIIDYEDQFKSEGEEEEGSFEDKDLVPYQSDVGETDLFHGDEEEEEDQLRAGMGGGWGRIIYMPLRRGRQVQMDICRATKRDGSEGAFERVVVTQSNNPVLHHQARRSIWGDLWPF
ncbi:methyltransferase-like protein 17 [Carex littledalei]|uniref:Methyltransferase-like protein 17 n=1 Tax=Carex littledalei TaxID=544730 RepID=A0A833QF80_9POAL|nr:methyltransferase-like protein 17 [Carex littledalei]